MKKVKVSERAVLARLNRKLNAEGLQIKKCRSDNKGYQELGDYYCVDLNRNGIDSKHVDLSQWAKEEQVLASYEEIES